MNTFTIIINQIKYKKMKKLALVIAIAGIFGLSSCKKCNTCELGNIKSEYCSDSYTDTELSVAESACRLGGGTWK